MYNAEETKNRILETAVRLFARKGLQAVSVADIVSAVGCSKGAFFYHFPTKDALIGAAFDRCHNAVEEAAMEGLDALPGIVDRFCRRCYNLTRYALRNPDVTTVNSLCLTDPAYIAKNGFGYRASRRHFESVNAMVEEGLAGGELKNLPPLLLGELYYSIAAVPYTYMQDNPECFGNSEYWDGFYEIIRCALAKRPSENKEGNP